MAQTPVLCVEHLSQETLSLIPKLSASLLVRKITLPRKLQLTSGIMKVKECLSAFVNIRSD